MICIKPSSCMSESPFLTHWPPSPSLSGGSRVWLLQAVVSHAGYWPGVHLRKPQPSSVWIQSHEVYSSQIVLQLSGSALSAHNWGVTCKTRGYYCPSRIEHFYRAAKVYRVEEETSKFMWSIHLDANNMLVC